MKTIIPVLAVCLLITGCVLPRSGPVQRPPTVFATEADKVLLAQWATLAAEENGMERSREMLNHTSMPDSQNHLAVMRGEKALWTENQVGRSRNYVKDGIAGIFKSRIWPEPPAYGVSRARAALTIDGKGDEPDWAGATPVPIRFPYAQTNAIDQPAATCRLLWDEKNLYLLFAVPDTNIVNLCTNRDEAVSQGDCVEIFLLPSKRFGQYWEFNFSPSGVVYDSLIAKYLDRWGGYDRIAENAALKIATTVDGSLNREEDRDRMYTVEVALPWEELPGFQQGAKPGDTLWTMIGWADKAGLELRGNPSYFSHTPVLAWFHNIWGYSRLTLE